MASPTPFSPANVKTYRFNPRWHEELMWERRTPLMFSDNSSPKSGLNQSLQEMCACLWCQNFESHIFNHIHTHTHRCRPKQEHAKTITTWILCDFEARVLNTTHKYGSICWFWFHLHFWNYFGCFTTLLWFGNIIYAIMGGRWWLYVQIG